MPKKAQLVLGLFVFLEDMLQLKGLFADGTLKWPFIAVNRLVGVQVSLGFKLFVAARALEHSNRTVDMVVPDQVTFVLKLGIT